MTSDGIQTEDWDLVHQAALDVANASSEGDDAAHGAAVQRLLGLLTRLEARYGPLPSILATRADYLDDAREAAELLKTAYRVAADVGDEFNILQTAESLAVKYIDDLEEADEGAVWLEAFRRSLATGGGESEIVTLERLASRLATLRRKNE